MFKRCVHSLMVSKKSEPTLRDLTRQLLKIEGVHGRTLMAKVGPAVRTSKGLFFLSVANLLCITTYLIMINWIYEGYVDLWYGVYGLDDDDEED